MKLLERFIRLELDEGPKINAALALALAAGAPAIRQASRDAERASPRIAHSQAARQQVEDPDDGYRPPIDDDDREQLGPTGISTKTYTRQQLMAFVQKASKEVGISPAFVDGIIWTETRYNPNAVSNVGAQGIAQFMPATAKQVGLDDPFNPMQAIPACAKHLKQLLDRYDGDYELAAAAYNSGPGNVDKYKGIPPFDETQKYVPDVIRRMKSSPLADASDEKDID